MAHTQFDYTHIQNNAPRTLFLLHGTGGSKDDLLFFNDYVGDHYNLVGLQGNIQENGMARFFKRTAPGVFDQESIKEETTKLQAFIHDFTAAHSTNLDTLSFVGYSNGANIILALLFYYPHLVRRAALMHPMLPFEPTRTLNLSYTQLLIANGQKDPMVPRHEQERLCQILVSRHAKIKIKEYPGGHAASQEEISDVVSFLIKDI